MLVTTATCEESDLKNVRMMTVQPFLAVSLGMFLATRRALLGREIVE